MKKLLTLIAAFSLCLFACEKEEENPEPSLEDVKFGFANQDEDLIPVPEALQEAEIPEATLALGWLNLANNLTSTYSQLFNVPANAVKSSNPVVPSNGRVAKAEYLVYAWEGPNGYGITYQVHKEGEKYVLEILYKMPQIEGWRLHLYAEQDRDGKNGKLKVYNIDSPESHLAFIYIWQTVGDVVKIEFGESETAIVVRAEANTKTGSGKVEYLDGEVVRLLINWNGDGSGSWTYYGDNGELTGTWEA